MMLPGPDTININDYQYDLPDDRIAEFPLEARDSSKLIICRDHEIAMGHFRDLPDYIPNQSLMVFNETRVIQARIIFYKESGARIEVFCLEPLEPSKHFELAFQQKGPVTWKCLVGNVKKWKQGVLIKEVKIGDLKIKLQATLKQSLEDAFLIEFSWDEPGLTFSEVLDASGQVPLPPYIKRASIASDKVRYQTIYAKDEGSVAAPTAGLHFTEQLIQQLLKNEVQFKKLTLHVGAGTFKPVSARRIKDHTMHSEQVIFSKDLLENLLSRPDDHLTAVGTTSVRSLESLYWLGIQTVTKNIKPDGFMIRQWEAYEQTNTEPSKNDALSAILSYMESHDLSSISGSTQMIIVPGYRFRFVDALVTNFHMPKSTLLLLVAALVGEPWRDVYQTALQNDFRFLSYGDSCLFFKQS